METCAKFSKGHSPAPRSEHEPIPRRRSTKPRETTKPSKIRDVNFIPRISALSQKVGPCSSPIDARRWAINRHPSLNQFHVGSVAAAGSK